MQGKAACVCVTSREGERPPSPEYCGLRGVPQWSLPRGTLGRHCCASPWSFDLVSVIIRGNEAAGSYYCLHVEIAKVRAVPSRSSGRSQNSEHLNLAAQAEAGRRPLSPARQALPSTGFQALPRVTNESMVLLANSFSEKT